MTHQILMRAKSWSWWGNALPRAQNIVRLTAFQFNFHEEKSQPNPPCKLSFLVDNLMTQASSVSLIKGHPTFWKALFAFQTFGPGAVPFASAFYFHCFNPRTMNQTLGFGSLLGACPHGPVWTISPTMLFCDWFCSTPKCHSIPSCSSFLPPFSTNLAMLVTPNRAISVSTYKTNPVHVVSSSLC